jgi:hypothetical protein
MIKQIEEAYTAAVLISVTKPQLLALANKISKVSLKLMLILAKSEFLMIFSLENSVHTTHSNAYEYKTNIFTAFLMNFSTFIAFPRR